MTNIVLHLSETAPITINALAKATELSPTQLTLELVELGGRVLVKDGGIVLAPPVVKEVKVRKSNGPRGQMAKGTITETKQGRKNIWALAEATE